MIIKILMDLIYTLFEVFTKAIDIPGMPEGLRDVLISSFTYIEFGLALLTNWTDTKYLLSLFIVVIAVDAGFFLYHFVMWVMRKLPMLGIE